MAASKSSAGAAAGGLLWWAIAGTALAGIVGATVWLGTRDQVSAVRTADVKYLAENAKKPGVFTTASGLQYQVIREGSGPKPAATDLVLVHYEGRLLDGTVFDSSYQRGQPAAFPLDSLIPGWSEGVQLMTVGSKYRFTVPSDLAYGAAGAGNAGEIPPNAVLQFDVELLAVKPQ